jgi:hypothetical protein
MSGDCSCIEAGGSEDALRTSDEDDGVTMCCTGIEMIFSLCGVFQEDLSVLALAALPALLVDLAGDVEDEAAPNIGVSLVWIWLLGKSMRDDDRLGRCRLLTLLLSRLETVEAFEEEDDADGESKLFTLPLPEVARPLPAASMGLFSGEMARDVKGDELPLPLLDRLPPLLRRILVIVFEMVWRAACFARSVVTKLLTRSFRLLFMSGDASISRALASCAPLPSSTDGRGEADDLSGSVADLDTGGEVMDVKGWWRCEIGT